jgi:hypothetical protein
MYYDALGRRVGEVSAGDKELYYSDAWQVLEEQNVACGVAATSSQYVWSPFYVDEVSVF